MHKDAEGGRLRLLCASCAGNPTRALPLPWRLRDNDERSQIGAEHVSYYLSYVERGGDAGRWLGKGAEELGLTGEVQPDAFANLAECRRPDGTKLLERIHVDRVMGWEAVVYSGRRERCESGRIGLTANELTWETGSEGSNPSLSASQPGNGRLPKTLALVAQRIRASDYGSEGCGFESRRARQISAGQQGYLLQGPARLTTYLTT